MTFRASLLTTICLALLINCSDGQQVEISAISVQQLHKMIEDGKHPLLIDVRTLPEFEEARPAAVVQRIPYDSLQFRLDELPKDSTAEIYFFCRSGRRSGIAARVAREHGYVNAHNVTGGIIAWREAGFPVASGPAKQD